MRRRRLILENKIIKPEKSGFYIGNHGRFTNQMFINRDLEIFEPFEPYKKNRFIIDLEIDTSSLSKKIPNSRIDSFKFVSDKNGTNIHIDIMLSIHEWVEDYLKVNICKIYLIDPTGKIIKHFDYDVISSGYEYDLKYESSNILKPRFFYKIIE